jgi:hypothetical protein
MATPKDELPGMVSNTLFLFNSALKRAQNAGLKPEITEDEVHTPDGRTFSVLKVVVRNEQGMVLA